MDDINKLLHKVIGLVEDANQCDDAIFHALTNVADAIVGNFGKYCEVVIHDLRQPESSIIYVAGNVTNRQIGSPITNFVLEELRKNGNNSKDAIGYRGTTKDGQVLKSSTVYIRNLNDDIIGTLCINYNTTMLAHDLQQFFAFDDSSNYTESDEFFPSDVNEILETIINQTMTAKGVPIDELKKEDKIRIVGSLDIKGVFLIKGAVDKVALALGVSRYTIYNYLEQDRSQRNAI